MMCMACTHALLLPSCPYSGDASLPGTPALACLQLMCYPPFAAVGVRPAGQAPRARLPHPPRRPRRPGVCGGAPRALICSAGGRAAFSGTCVLLAWQLACGLLSALAPEPAWSHAAPGARALLRCPAGPVLRHRGLCQHGPGAARLGHPDCPPAGFRGAAPHRQLQHAGALGKWGGGVGHGLLAFACGRGVKAVVDLRQAVVQAVPRVVALLPLCSCCSLAS